MNEWLALMRVHEGGVTKLDGYFFNRGQPVVNYLAAAVEELIGAELLALGRPDPIGAQQVCVTHNGQVRYAQLSSNGGQKARHRG